MPAWEIIVQVKKDGVDLAGFPFRRTVETAEGSDFNVVKSGGDTVGVYTPFPGLIVGSALSLFCAASDQPILLKPGALTGADGIISLLAGGLVLLFNCNEAADSGDQIEINNVPVNPANVKGAWGSG